MNLKYNYFIFIMFITLFLICNGFQLSVHAEDPINGEIIIHLYTDTPAQNQEVLLSIDVIDFRRFSTSNLSLNITLTCLFLPPYVKDLEFLNDPNPITNENGEYTTIFNAPVFGKSIDVKYEIKVKVELIDNTILFGTHMFNVQEKMFDTKYDERPEPAAPGTWYSIVIYNYDFKPLTVSSLQNGITKTKTWEIQDFESVGSEIESNIETGERKTISEIFRAGDEYTVVDRYERYEGNSETLVQINEYPAKTIKYKFLVTEIFGNKINITFSGLINGQKIENFYVIPTIPLNKPSIGITDRMGKWYFSEYFDGNDRPGTRQNEEVLIYGIGFKGNVHLKIYNMTEVIFKDDRLSNNYVTLFKWNVSENLSTGFYNLTLGEYESNKYSNKQNIRFYVGKKLENIGNIPDTPSEEHVSKSEMNLYFAIISIILIVFIIIFYIHLRRKKIIK